MTQSMKEIIYKYTHHLIQKLFVSNRSVSKCLHPSLLFSVSVRNLATTNIYSNIFNIKYHTSPYGHALYYFFQDQMR